MTSVDAGISTGAALWMVALTILTLAALGVAFYAVYTLVVIREQAEGANDDATTAVETAGKALTKVQDIEDHMNGAEPATSGRHHMAPREEGHL